MQIHRLMLKDVPRTEAYQKAILGNKELFEGKVVMDIGAGTGKENENQFFPSLRNQSKKDIINLFLIR